MAGFELIVRHAPVEVRRRLEQQIAPEGTRADSDDRLGRYRRGGRPDSSAPGETLEVIRYTYTGKYGSARYAPTALLIRITPAPEGARVAVQPKTVSVPLGGRIFLYVVLNMPLILLVFAFAFSPSDMRHRMVKALPALIVGGTAITGLFASLPKVALRANLTIERDFLRGWLGGLDAKPPVADPHVRVLVHSLFFLCVYFVGCVFVAGLLTALVR